MEVSRKCPNCKEIIPFETLMKFGRKKNKPIKCPKCSSEYIWDMKSWYLWYSVGSPGGIYLCWYLIAVVLTKKVQGTSLLGFLVYPSVGLCFLSIYLPTQYAKLVILNKE